jgi:Xaa-Pro dipeptidase
VGLKNVSQARGYNDSTREVESINQSTTQRRLGRLREAMARDGIAAMLIAPGDDLRYLTGYAPHMDERLCFLVVGERSAVFVVPGVNATEARTRLEVLGIPVLEYSDAGGPAAALRRAVHDAAGSGGGRMMASDTARFDHVRMVEAALEPADLGLTSPILRQLRIVKDQEEIEALRASARLDDEAMRAAWAAVRVGMTELDVRDVIYRAFVGGGADEASFMLVAFGPGSAEPHHASGPVTIGHGPLTLDIGCRHHGYASDLTRMAYVGTPDPEYLKVHEIVRQARLAGQQAARLGAPCSAVDRAARQVIEEAGYGPYFVHRTGHGIGVSTHEPPNMMEGDETILEPGMAFSIEPGIYLPGRFGVRIEDVAVMTEAGPEILSELPHEVHIIE